MKQMIRSIFFRTVKASSLIILLFTLGGAPILAQYVSINTNGSFEQSDTTSMAEAASVPGWSFNVASPAVASFAIEDSVVKDGIRALEVTIDSLATNSWDIQIVNEPFVVKPGVNYTFTLWAKASAPDLEVALTVGNPSYEEFARTGIAVGTEWQKYTIPFTPGANDTVGRAPIHLNYTGNAGQTFWFDSVRISTENTLPIIVEAESGVIGADIATQTEGDITYVSTTVNNSEFVPGNESRVITYQVTFPGPGSYELFSRQLVGTGAFNDDSFFYGNGFGEHHPDSANQWVLVNGMASAGFTNSGDLVRAAGGAGSEVWKWVNHSRNAYGSGAPVTFVIEEGDSLTQTFQIGTREDGFNIDKFAFGDSAVFFTVENLSNGEPGSLIDPTIPTETFEPIALGKNKFLGNIHSGAQLPRFTEFWNQVTPENSGKWGSVEGTRDQMNWTGLDEAYNLAKDNGFPFRFHILIWGGQQPGWINDLEPEEQLEEITEWFEAVAERYPDIDYLEVVNEGSNGHQLPDGISGSANYIEALGGTGETGHDWIIKSFEMARDIFPSSVKLMINDYGIMGNTIATNNYIKIINDLKARDLIDVIGVQSHAFNILPATPAALKRTLDDLAKTGLYVMATEMDIDGDYPDQEERRPEDESAQAQLERYQRIFPIFWEHPNVIGVTLWGWRPGLWRNDQEAYLVNPEGEFRPALEWLRTYVDTAEVDLITIGTEDDLQVDIPGEFSLNQNYPNPFNPSTQISYTLARNSSVRVNVYDISGRMVKQLVNTTQAPGSYQVTFDASSLSSGVYFYELVADGFTDVKKMLLVK